MAVFKGCLGGFPCAVFCRTVKAVLKKMTEASLATLGQGETAVVIAMQGGPGFMRRLRNIGIREGRSVKVVATHPFGGPVVVEVDGRQITLGRNMASRVTVGAQ